MIRPAAPATMGRMAPPDRRQSETRRIRWSCPLSPASPETTIHVTIGYDVDFRRPIEIFYAGGYRSGSEVETQVSDMCIVLSHMLQRSDSPDPSDILGTVAREADPVTGEVRPASLVGVLLEELRKPPHWWPGEPGSPGDPPLPQGHIR